MRIILLRSDIYTEKQILSIFPEINIIDNFSDTMPNDIVIVPAFGKHREKACKYFIKNKLLELMDLRKVLFLVNKEDYNIFNDGYNCWTLDYPFYKENFEDKLENVKNDNSNLEYQFNTTKEDTNLGGKKHFHLAQFGQSINSNKAKKHLIQSVKNEPKMIGNRLMLSKILQKQHRNKEAKEVMLSLRRDHPHSMDKISQINSYYGDLLINEKKYKEATSILTRASYYGCEESPLKIKSLDIINSDLTTNDEEVGVCLGKMGVNHCEIGNYEEGIKFFIKAIKILGVKSPVYNIYYNLGLAYLKISEIAKAISICHKMKQILPVSHHKIIHSLILEIKKNTDNKQT